MFRFGIIFLMLWVSLCWISCELGGSTDTDNGVNEDVPTWELRSLDSGSVWDSTQFFIAGLGNGGAGVYEAENSARNYDVEVEVKSNFRLDGGELADTITSIKTYSLDSGAMIVLYDLNGNPQRDFGFRLIPTDFNPVMDTVPGSWPMYITDEFGVAVVNNIPPNAVNLEAVNTLSGEKRLYLLPLSLARNKVQFHRFYLQGPNASRGKVSRASGLQFDSLAVFFRGSTRLVYSDSAGNFDFGVANIQISTLEFFISSSTNWSSSPNSFNNDSLATPDIASDCQVKNVADSELETNLSDKDIENQLGIWVIEDIDSNHCLSDSLEILDSLISEQRAVIDSLGENNSCNDALDCGFQFARFNNGCQFSLAYNNMDSDTLAIKGALDELVGLNNQYFDLETRAGKSPDSCEDFSPELTETACENNLCIAR